MFVLNTHSTGKAASAASNHHRPADCPKAFLVQGDTVKTRTAATKINGTPKSASPVLLEPTSDPTIIARGISPRVNSTTNALRAHGRARNRKKARTKNGRLAAA